MCHFPLYGVAVVDEARIKTFEFENMFREPANLAMVGPLNRAGRHFRQVEPSVEILNLSVYLIY